MAGEAEAECRSGLRALQVRSGAQRRQMGSPGKLANVPQEGKKGHGAEPLEVVDDPGLERPILAQQPLEDPANAAEGKGRAQHAGRDTSAWARRTRDQGVRAQGRPACA